MELEMGFGAILLNITFLGHMSEQDLVRDKTVCKWGYLHFE